MTGPVTRAVAVAAVLLGILALVTALALRHSDASPGTRAHAVPVADRGVVPTTGATAGSKEHSTAARPTARTVTTHLPVPAGSRLRLARLGVDAPVGQVRAVAGVMRIPANPRDVAWWRDGAAPGDARGTAVIVGHINYAGTDGALSVLPEARPGDVITLAEPGSHARTLRYRVQAVRVYAKSRGIPAEVFSRSGTARLALVTCGGPFDPSTGNYLDNVVVYATPA